jgi:NAD(P)H dehydrogenase (quinone)
MQEVNMTGITVAVVYSSSRGHTRRAAEHVAKGAGSFAGVTADLIEITAAQIGPDGRWQDSAIMERLDKADAIIFGAPTYMGSAHGVFKLFPEAAFMPRWTQQRWKDKVGAGFTNAASRSGDKLITLQQFAIFAAQMGMIWAGVGDPPGGNRTDSTPDDVNHLGSWLGLMTQSPSPADGDAAKGFASAGDLLTAERFGRRIARVASRWALGAAAFPPQPFGEGESKRRDRAGLDEWRRFED